MQRKHAGVYRTLHPSGSDGLLHKVYDSCREQHRTHMIVRCVAFVLLSRDDSRALMCIASHAGWPFVSVAAWAATAPFPVITQHKLGSNISPTVRRKVFKLYSEFTVRLVATVETPAGPVTRSATRWYSSCRDVSANDITALICTNKSVYSVVSSPVDVLAPHLPSVMSPAPPIWGVLHTFCMRERTRALEDNTCIHQTSHVPCTHCCLHPRRQTTGLALTAACIFMGFGFCSAAAERQMTACLMRASELHSEVAPQLQPIITHSRMAAQLIAAEHCEVLKEVRACWPCWGGMAQLCSTGESRLLVAPFCIPGLH